MKDAVHPAISLGISLWYGLCVGLTIWLFHPSPNGKDLRSVLYTALLFFVGAILAKRAVLIVLTIIEKLHRRPS